MRYLSRREMLTATGAGGLLALAPAAMRATDGAKSAPVESRGNCPVYRFRIGAIEAVAIVTGFLRIWPDKPLGLSDAEYNAAVADFDYPGELRLDYNVLLLRTGDDNILIDSGPGASPSAVYDLVTSLRGVGLTPDDITKVFLTHAHFDHLGGLIDASGKVLFSRAEHYCFGEEIDFWMSPKPDFSKLRLAPAPLLALARRVFEAVPFRRIEANTRLPKGITPILSPGHTPGHMTLEIRSEGDVVYHISDLSHHAALLARPEWPVVSDIDPEQAVATRKRIFATLAAQRTRVFGFHLPFPGVGRLRTNGTGYRWIPDLWQDGGHSA